MAKYTTSHPLQPLVLDKHGRPRFKQNAIVSFLLDTCSMKNSVDLNTLATMSFSREDREQFAQLIGYSLTGFGELSYVRNKTYYAAAELAEKLERKHGKKEKREKKLSEKERKLEISSEDEG